MFINGKENSVNWNSPKAPVRQLKYQLSGQVKATMTSEKSSSCRVAIPYLVQFKQEATMRVLTTLLYEIS